MSVLIEYRARWRVVTWFVALAAFTVISACRAPGVSGASGSGDGPGLSWLTRPSAHPGVRVAQATHGSRTPRPARTATPNVFMTVTAWQGSTKLNGWSGDTYWNGSHGTYKARVHKRKLHWNGGTSITGLRVHTDIRGARGIALAKWLPRGTTRVVVVIGPQGFGQNPNGGQGGTNHRSPATSAPGTGSETAPGELEARDAHGRGSAQGDSSIGPDGDSGDGNDAEDGAEDGDDGEDGGENADRDSDPGTATERDASTRPADGVGQENGHASGQAGGKTREQGGVADAYAARLTAGQDHGDPEGGRGGEGAAGDAGARGAFALFGGILNVPRAWRAAVEVAILAGQALSPDTAFKAVVRKLGVRRLGIVSLRRELRREARDYAKSEVKRLRKQFTEELDSMAKKDRDNLLRATHDHKVQQYFDKVEEGARVRRVEFEVAQKANPNDAEAAAELAQARSFEEAAAVKPVAGQFPLNHRYAGKTYPVSNIDSARYPEAVAAIEKQGLEGVPFTREGYPDFTPWLYKKGDVAADVRIEYTGKRYSDFKRADEAMRHKLGDSTWKAPDDYTWHHHEDVGRMILVPTELNNAIGHTGGIPMYRMTTGEYDAYQRM